MQEGISQHERTITQFRIKGKYGDPKGAHGPEQADLRLHLRQRQAGRQCGGVSGAAGTEMGPVDEEMQAVPVC
jgi:hypothetical protein